MVGSKHLPLLWSVAGQTSPGTAKLCSAPQAPLNHDRVWCLQTCCIRRWGSPRLILTYFSLCSIFFPCSSFGQEYFWVINFEMGRGPISQPGAVPIYWRWSQQVLSTPSLSISTKVISVGSWESHMPLMSGTHH